MTFAASSGQPGLQFRAMTPVRERTNDRGTEQTMQNECLDDASRLSKACGDELFHVGTRQRRPRAPLVPVVAFARLLAEPRASHSIPDLRDFAAVLARAPTNIKSGQISIAGPIGIPNLVITASTCSGNAPWSRN